MSPHMYRALAGKLAGRALYTALSAGALAASLGLPATAYAGSLERQTDVAAPASAVWAAIGPFCAIKEWHPAIGVCVTDGKNPPTRTLITKDGNASFVETEKARNDAKFLYSYNFVTSPLPAPKYLATIRVVPKGANASTIVWHGDYTAEPGKDKDVAAALTNIYETGLAAVKARFAK